MHSNQPRWKSPIIAFVVVFGAVLGAGLLGLRWHNAPSPSSADSNDTRDTIPNWRELASEGQSQGSASAPVTLLIFADYECRGCAELHGLLHAAADSLSQPFHTVTRHFPLSSHRHAAVAANAAECAQRQGRFAAFEDALYSWQDSIGVAPWAFFAAAANVRDTAELSRCIRTERYMTTVTRDRSVARTLKLEGTPTYIINGRRRFGTPTLAALVQQLRDAQLAEANTHNITSAVGESPASDTASVRWTAPDARGTKSTGARSATARHWLPSLQLQQSIIGAPGDELLVPGNLTATNDGNLLLFDYGSMELRKFALSGAQLWRAGRKGAGPGEFRNAMDVETLSNGNTVVLDMANRRVTTISNAGKVLRTAPIRQQSSRFVPFTNSETLAFAGDDTATLWFTVNAAGEPALHAALPQDMAAHHSLVRELFATPLQSGAVIAFRWSDRLLLLDNNGTTTAVFHGIEPVELPLAKSYPMHAGKFQGNVSRVDPNATPAALSVAADTGRIMVLFAGRSPERGRIIDIYHRRTGDYLGSYLLPQPAQEITGLPSGAIATLRAEPVPAIDIWLNATPPRNEVQRYTRASSLKR